MSGAVGPRSPRIYNLFPLLVGPVSEWMKHIPRIAAMGFNWIYLNPFHLPGFSGSIYAIRDYRQLNPLLHGQSYENDFQLIQSFCEIAATRGINVMADFVINHTSKDNPLVRQHPTWFLHDASGEVISPGTTDPNNPAQFTTWGDLAEIDYSDRPDRQDIIAFWCTLVQEYVKQGIRGLRCDAAYRIPVCVWRQVMDAAQAINPDILFFAETLGCRAEETESLAPAHFDFFFNSSKWWDFRQPWLLEQQNRFRCIAPSVSFTETHDTPRLGSDLAAQGISDVKTQEFLYKQRYLFAALFSSSVMIPVGFEFGFLEKLHVVTTRPEHWEKPRFDISAFITTTNRLKASLAVLNREGPIERLDSPSGSVGLLRLNDDGGPEWVLIVLNPSDTCKCALPIPSDDPIATLIAQGVEKTPGRLLASGHSIALDKTGAISLSPGEVRVFCGDTRLTPPRLCGT